MADQDYEDLIDTLIAEAGGESRAGQIATAYAIANRAAKKGKTPGEIVRKRKQFEGYSNPGTAARRAQKDPQVRARMEKLWDEVSTGAVPDPLNGGTMFHANSITPYWADEENKHGKVKIGEQTYYKGGAALPPESVPQVATALDAIQQVAPAAVPNPTLRSAYAVSMAPVPQSRPDISRLLQSSASPAVKRSFTDDLVRNSTTSQNVYSALQAVLDARYPATKPLSPASVYGQGGPTRPQAIAPSSAPQSIIERAAARPSASARVVSASDRARGNVGAGLPQKLPGMSSWNDFYAGITPASAQSPVPASVEDRVAARNDAIGAPTRVAGVSDIGKPYSFKAVQETMNPRGTRSVVPSQTPVAKSSTSFVAPAPPASPALAYNAVTPAQREVLSSVSALDRLLPSRLPDTPLTSSTLKPAQVATMGVGLGGAVDASGRRVTVPTSSPVSAYLASAPVPATRKSPAVQAIADAAPVQPAPVAREPMGGPVSAYDAVVGPTPAPRLDRPGFLPGVKLPGLLGAAQQFSKVLANASGPFNNGVDNALVQQMRGGNFTAPGAATRQGTNGFLYAPRQGGGWTNVGAANPSLSPAERYARAAANSRTGKPNAYDRMKAGRDDSSGPSSLVG